MELQRVESKMQDALVGMPCCRMPVSAGRLPSATATRQSLPGSGVQTDRCPGAHPIPFNICRNRRWHCTLPHNAVSQGKARPRCRRLARSRCAPTPSLEHKLTPGAEIVKQAAERGATIAINYASSKDRAEELCKSLPGSGHVVVQGDAFTHEGCDGIVAEATKALGGLDAVVSNQGATKFASWADLSEAAWVHVRVRAHTQSPSRMRTG